MKILYPVENGKNEPHTFAFAMQLAKRCKAKLIIFANIPQNGTEKDIDELYSFFLKLNGFFLTFISRWRKSGHVKQQRIVRRGDFHSELKKVIRTEGIDLLVCDRSVSHLQALEKWLGESGVESVFVGESRGGGSGSRQ
jgi:hypothetical protein